MRYSMPGGASEGTGEGDKAVLEVLKSRKELRSAVGVKLVKMEVGVSDPREIEWDVEWEEDEEDEEEEEEYEEYEDEDEDT